MDNLKSLSLIASDLIASKIARPKAYANVKFICTAFICFIAIIATGIMGIIAGYIALVQQTAVSELNAIFILIGFSLLLSVITGFLAYHFFKKEQLKAYIEARATCELALVETVKILQGDVSKPIQENPLVSIAIAGVAGAVVGKKF